MDCRKKDSASRSYNPSLRTNDGTWAKSDQEKAMLLANHIKDAFQVNDMVSHHFSNFPTSEDGVIQHTTPNEVTKIIDKMRLKKSSGLDNILSVMIRELPRKGIIFIVCFINSALHARYISLVRKKS